MVDSQCEDIIYSTLVMPVIDSQTTAVVYGVMKTQYLRIHTKRYYAIFSRSWEELSHCCPLWIGTWDGFLFG